MNINHMQYQWPLGKKVPLNIYPCSFGQLFCDYNHITLPIFQRHYCWTESQFNCYWKDMLHTLKIAKDEWDTHHFGKMYFFIRENQEIIILDGQQRICTSFIALIAIKKHLLSLISKKNNNNNNNNINHDNYKQAQDAIDRLDKLLFNDINININKNENKQIPKMEDGMTVDYVRFIPNYMDRQPYYSILFDCNDDDDHDDDESNIDNTSDAYDDDDDDSVGISSNLHKCLICFSKKMKEYKINDIKMIDGIIDTILNRFNFVITGISVEHQNKGYFIYQWLIEKALFGFKAALSEGKEGAGEAHEISEMFKNYILAFFINCDETMQKSMYLVWMSMELLYQNQIEQFGYYLKSLLPDNNKDKEKDKHKHKDKEESKQQEKETKKEKEKEKSKVNKKIDNDDTKLKTNTNSTSEKKSKFQALVRKVGKKMAKEGLAKAKELHGNDGDNDNDDDDDSNIMGAIKITNSNQRLYVSYRKLTIMIESDYLKKENVNSNEQLYPQIIKQFLYSLKQKCPKYQLLIVGFVRNHCKEALNNNIFKIVSSYSI